MFDYHLPTHRELMKDTKVPWKISDRCYTYIRVIFSSPYNRYHLIYTKHRNQYTERDMSKRMMRAVLYWRQYPQRFNHDPRNVYPYLFVLAWRSFAKQFSVLPSNPYPFMPTPRKLILKYGEELFGIISDELDNPIPDRTRKYSAKLLTQRERSRRHFERLASYE